MPATPTSIDLIVNKSAVQHPTVLNSKVMPQHEFSMLIVAPKGGGKTNMIANLLLKHYKGYFHKVWVCSPTVNNDDKWDVVKGTAGLLKRNKKLEKAIDGIVDGRQKIKKVVFGTEAQLAAKTGDEPFDGKIPEIDFFSDMRTLLPRLEKQQETIEKLRSMGKEQKAKFIADRLLIILDDQAGLFQGGNYNNPIVNIVIKHRHYSSSLIIVTQAYKAVPKTIRSNCNAIVLFEIPNASELHSIYEENPEGMDEKTWLRTYNECTREPYNFMYMNVKFEKGKRLFHNFDTRMRLNLRASDGPPVNATVGRLSGKDRGSQEGRRSSSSSRRSAGDSVTDMRNSKRN